MANDDEGFTSDLLPINVNVGEKVVSALRANDQIDWVFTDADEAIEGTRSGKYYAALVIPADFSRQMLTFYEGDSPSAEINYYVNKKKNAIAPNITNTGADTVSQQVNETFAETLSEVATGLVQSLSEHAEDADLTGQVADLTDHVRNMSAIIGQAADVLELYSSLAKDSQGLVEGTSQVIASVRTQIDRTSADVDNDKGKLRSLATKLSSSADALSGSLADNDNALSGLEDKVDAVLEDASADASAVAVELRSLSGEVDERASDCSSALATLEALRSDIQSAADALLDEAIDSSGSEGPEGEQAGQSEQGGDAKRLYENLPILDKAISSLSKTLGILQDASTALNDAADDLETGGANAQEKVDSLRSLLGQVRDSVDEMKSDFEKNTKPGIDRLKSDIASLASGLDQSVAALSSLSPDLISTVAALGSTLGNASEEVDGASAKLRTASQSLADLAAAADAALASGDTEALQSLLRGSAGDLAAALAAPVQVERTALFPVDGFGSAMAPLYTTLALFIGSLLIMVALKPEVSERGKELLVNPKPRELYFGRFGVVALLSLLQTTLMGLGHLFFLKVQVAQPMLFMLCFWVSGLVFAFIVYTLVVAFGNLGKAIAVLLLIVQVTGCGGSYPLQLLPDFVQAVSPFVPATYVVDALRAAMMGVYHNDFWVAIGKLLLFVLPFLLLGLVLRKPLDKFMRFYVSKVEESKLVD